MALVWSWFKMSWALCFTLAQLWISCCLKWVLHPPQRVLNLEAGFYFDNVQRKAVFKRNTLHPRLLRTRNCPVTRTAKAHFTHPALLCSYCRGSDQLCQGSSTTPNTGGMAGRGISSCTVVQCARTVSSSHRGNPENVRESRKQGLILPELQRIHPRLFPIQVEKCFRDINLAFLMHQMHSSESGHHNLM